jgi:hypothetical protein
MLYDQTKHESKHHIFKYIKVIHNRTLPEMTCIRVGIVAKTIRKSQIDITPKLVGMSNYSMYSV